MADPDKIGIGKISQSETGKLVACDPWLVKQSMLDAGYSSRIEKRESRIEETLSAST